VREPFSAFIEAISEEFASLRMLAERAAAQVSDEQFFANLDTEANSVGTLMQHIGGNLRSRWQDFRTTDGEKPDRYRDREFEAGLSRADVEAKWRQGWAMLHDGLASLTPADLDTPIVIRGQAASLPRSLRLRQNSFARPLRVWWKKVLICKLPTEKVLSAFLDFLRPTRNTRKKQRA